jgi:flagellar operon protein
MAIDNIRPPDSIHKYANAVKQARPNEGVSGLGTTVKPGLGNQVTLSGLAVPQTDDFRAILKEKIDENKEVKFSKHATQRLGDRNITLDKDQTDKLERAVDKAKGKGLKDTLVIMDNVAMVVNVNNRTVITAVSKDEMKENVFTNIDGAVFT